jgi:hypothetical protein
MPPSAEEILNKVKNHRNSTDELRVRMEADYLLWRLDEYDAGEDYESYTSNEPRAYADKIVAWLVDASLTIRMPMRGAQRSSREQMSAKERFLTGILESADERLLEMILPGVREQLAWYICLRGWWSSLSILRKLQDGSTIVDIRPWDPMHTYWGLGDKGGLEWACLHMRKTRGQILADHEHDIGEDEDNELGHDVYSYYDRTHHGLVIGSSNDASTGELIRPVEPHGALKVPVSIGMVGAAPPIQGYNGSGDDYGEDSGESIFGANRALYEKRDQVMSIMLELVARSKKQPYIVKSRDGSKTLEEDPSKQGSEVAIAEGDDVRPMEQLRMAIDTLPFLGSMSSEIQRGAIPYSAFGELGFQLSGFAITQLNDNIGTILQPRSKAMERAYRQICMMISDQYETGGFQSIQVNGFDLNREYFSETIEPDAIKGTGSPQFRMTAILPADDQGKMQIAQVARQGPVPLLPDQYIWDTILQIQNPDELSNKIKEQLAEQASPKAALFTLIKALLARGEQELVMIYVEELENLMLQESVAKQQMMMSAMQQGGMPPGGMPPGGMPPGGGGPPPSGPPGQVPAEVPPNLPPEVLPSQLQGIPQAPPTPQAGPNVPPGTPRPGAQNGGRP